MIKLKRNNLIIIIFGLIFLIIYLIFLNANPISTYQLSIYADIPYIIWLLPAISIGLFVFCLLRLYLNKMIDDPLNYLLIFLIFFSLELIFLAPYLRGAIYVGTTQDSIAQIGYVNQIYNSGFDTSYYPGIIEFFAFFSILTNINPLFVSGWFHAILQPLIIIISYFLGMAIFKERSYAMFTMIYSILFQATPLEFSLARINAFLLVPLIIGVWFNKERGNQWSILLVILMISINFFHQFIALSLLFGFIGLVIFPQLLRKTINTNFEKYTKSGVFILIFGFIVYILWNFYYHLNIIRSPLQDLLRYLFYGEIGLSPNILQYFGKFGLSLYDQLFLYLRIYFNNISSVFIVALSLIIIFKSIRQNKKLFNNLLLMIGFTIFLLVNFLIYFLAFLNNVFSFVFGMLGFTGIVASPFAAYLFSEVIINRQEKVGKIKLFNRQRIVLGISIFFIFSILIMSFNLYVSPEYYLVRSDPIATSEIIGTNTSLNIIGNFPFWIVYGDSRYIESVIYLPLYYKKFEQFHIQFNIYNWYNEERERISQPIYLFMTKGRLLRTLNIPIPKDLAFTEDNFIQLNRNVNNNKIYSNDGYFVYYIYSNQIN